MRRVLVLRPEPGASATLRRARELGLNAISMPLFEVAPMTWTAPDPTQLDGLLLTSANAIRHGGSQLALLRSLKVYAVGEATAEAARQAGFDVVITGDGGVDRLLASMKPGLRLVHLSGEDRRDQEQPKQQITATAVYRSKAIENPDLTEVVDCIALIHSPRAGARFAELVRDRKSIIVAAVSAAAAQAAGEGWERVEAAAQPNDGALLALAASLCNNPQPK